MLAAIAGETCAGINSTSAEVFIVVIIIIIIIILIIIVLTTATTIVVIIVIVVINIFQPMLAATIAVDACAGLNATSPEVQIIIIIIISIILRIIMIIVIDFFQVDLAGAVLANSTVGAEEMISWACDQYFGKSSSPLSWQW